MNEPQQNNRLPVNVREGIKQAFYILKNIDIIVPENYFEECHDFQKLGSMLNGVFSESLENLKETDYNEKLVELLKYVMDNNIGYYKGDNYVYQLYVFILGQNNVSKSKEKTGNQVANII